MFPLDLRVKPEDDKGGETPAGPEDDNTKNCPKMTKENKRPKMTGGE